MYSMFFFLYKYMIIQDQAGLCVAISDFKSQIMLRDYHGKYSTAI